MSSTLSLSHYTKQRDFWVFRLRYLFFANDLPRVCDANIFMRNLAIFNCGGLRVSFADKSENPGENSGSFTSSRCAILALIRSPIDGWKGGREALRDVFTIAIKKLHTPVMENNGALVMWTHVRLFRMRLFWSLHLHCVFVARVLHPRDVFPRFSRSVVNGSAEILFIELNKVP